MSVPVFSVIQLSLFFHWSIMLLLHSHHLFTASAVFLVEMSVFFVCVLERFWPGCLLLLFSAVAAVMWGYFGNTPHLPPSVFLWWRRLPGAGSNSPWWKGEAAGDRTGCEASPQTSYEGQWHATLTLSPVSVVTPWRWAQQPVWHGEHNSREAIISTWFLRLPVTLQFPPEWSVPKQ